MFTPSAHRQRHASPKKHVDRREERLATMKSGSICVDGEEMNFACTVRDIHSSGARLSIMNMDSVADGFLLIVRSENLVARSIVAWKKSNEIGVRFLRIGDLTQEEQFRREQKRAYQKDIENTKRIEQQAKQQAQAQAHARQQAEAQRIAQIRIAQMQIMGMDPTKPYSERDLKSAYRRQAMVKHPDQGGDPLEFQKLTDVYQTMLSAFESMQSLRNTTAA